MSRIVRFHRLGGPEVLEIEKVADREPDVDEVRVRVRAIGLNRADVMFRRGTYIEKASFPSRLGYEASGHIEALGGAVEDLSIGDPVCVVPSFDLSRHGTYGETVTVPARALVPKPDACSFEAAASAWMQYIVAYGALAGVAGLTAGDRVLITAASSSVGIAAVQTALALGAVPIATTLDGAQKDALLALGVPHVVSMRDDDLAADIDRISAGAGLRVAFDAVGGSQIETIASMMAPGGVIVSHGALSNEPTPFPLRYAIRNSLSMHGYVFTQTLRDDALRNAATRFIRDGLTTGALVPVIDRVFDFDDIVAAHRYLEQGRQIGKVVVTLPA